MGNQGYRSNYLAAFDSANHQLESIYAEYHELQRRREKLEGVVTALEPFLQSDRSSAVDFRLAEPAHMEPEPARTEFLSAAEPVAEPALQAQSSGETPAAPAYTAAAEELDPLQMRINRALGLAVA
jgi:hypothetical protein